MHTRTTFVILTVVSAMAACHSDTPVGSKTQPQNDQSVSAAEMLNSMRSVEHLQVLGSATGYRCATVLPMVNKLRHLGKTQVLSLLEDYYKGQRDHDPPILPAGDDNLIVLCRLLFVPPKEGWKAPYESIETGAVLANPAFRHAGASKFPLMPVAISDGVPFILTDYVSGSGFFPEEGKVCLQQCASLELITSDWPTSGLDRAAEDLLKSTLFQQLYLTAIDQSAARDQIRTQAGIPYTGPNRLASKINGMPQNLDRQKRGLPPLLSNWLLRVDGVHAAIWLNPVASEQASVHNPMHSAKKTVLDDSGTRLIEIDEYQSGRRSRSAFYDPGQDFWEILTITYNFAQADAGDNPWRCTLNCGSHEKPFGQTLGLEEALAILREWGISELEYPGRERSKGE